MVVSSSRNAQEFCTGKGFSIMLKKLLIAAAAVVVGLVIVKKTDLGSLAQVWWKDAGAWCSRQVAPETRIKQLKLEIGKIDNDIRSATNSLVKQEVVYRSLKDEVDGLRAKQDQRKKDMLTLIEALEANSTQVSLQGQTYSSEVAQIKLEGLKSEYETGKNTLKLKEQNLGVKTNQLESADARIKKIQSKKDELNTLVAQLEAQLENLRLKQVENNVTVSDTQVSKCENLARNLKSMLAEEEIRVEKYARYGLLPSNSEPAKEHRSKGETIKAARAVLAEEKVAGEQ
jgi:chromosome segregation ATPase